jgi:hypothetical protein
MYYIELLRTWRVFWRYLIVLAGLLLLAAILNAIFQHVESSDAGVQYSVGGHAVIVAFICLLFASVAGSSLGRHFDHLDFALTKPRARTVFAANVAGIDVLGLTVFFITTAVWVIAIHVAAGIAHGVVFDAASSFGIALAFGSVLAWYAIVQAVSCGKDASGWAIAGVWIVALSLNFLGPVPLGPGLNALVGALNLINPIAYLSMVPFEAVSAPSVSLAAHTFAIYVIAAGAALIALIRWQRVEA